MELNTATMIDIVQYYIDNKLWNPNESRPKVIGVESVREMASTTFQIKLESKTEE